MSIDRAAVKLWGLLRERGLLGGRHSILEIGEANWFGDVELEEVAGVVKTPKFAWDQMDLFGKAREYYHWLLNPRFVDTIDAGGVSEHVHRIDLNEPIGPASTLCCFHDIIINTGTIEHVFDQRQVFETIHNLTAINGLMIHAFPVEGCIDHGFYNHQPNLLNAIAAANKYEHLGAVVSEGNGDKIIHLAWRKTHGGPFVVPQQSHCAGVNGGGFIPVESKQSQPKPQPTERTSQMAGITREELLAEKARLAIQRKQAEDGIAAAQRVYQDNVNLLNSVGGAQQMNEHLLKMLDAKEQGQANQAPPAEQQCNADGGQSCPPGCGTALTGN